MKHDYLWNTKNLVLGACAAAAGILLGPGFVPAEASAADYRHGTMQGRNIYACNELEHYIETAHAYEDESRSEGKKQLEAHLREGVCKMLPKGTRVTVKGAHKDHDALKVEIEGDSKEWWVNGKNFKHN